MTFHKDIKDSHCNYLSIQEEEDICFECGKQIEKGVVRYDGHFGQASVKTVSFHPVCASIVGQRLVVDGYPNRYK